MELEHFSHSHSLAFKDEQVDYDVEIPCYGCRQSIWGPYYACISCNYYLHKSCAELPHQMTHPLHLQHPLTLFPHPPPGFGNCCCAACGRRCHRFFYMCSQSCYFHLDVICLFMMGKIQHKIKHKFHEHPLTSLQTPASFFCSACGSDHRGSSYLCTTCGFWINQKCALLPITITCGDHHHPLSLSFSIPEEYYWVNSVNCDVCAEDLNKPHWMYSCTGCRYFSHINCAISNTNLSRDSLNLLFSEFSNLDLNAINFPRADESVETMILFANNISLQGKHQKAGEITHVSHDHPLIFVNPHTDNKTCDDDKCNGCAQPISPPFYHCAPCNFFLHERCVELLDELSHPCHPEHPLLLIVERDPDSHLRLCNCCTKYCNVFMFGCALCEFYLDIACASLPHIIRHEAHKHTLSLKISYGSCSACNGKFSGFVFVCDTCNFNLCDLCARLPGKLRHRYDEHPFMLMYSPLENYLDLYYCEICEREINPKRWFYHCVKCDQSLHTGCIHPHLVDQYSNVKFGATFAVDEHPHLVTLVRLSKKKASGGPCHSCGEVFNHDTLALECIPCNFRLHYDCAFDSEDDEL